ncbi:hypothetical protein [Gluconacetobacter sacchari]|uniref:Uncharacterized protein n=2 Tax=Gluconacetobacter sacchari TaxID=92759 RepID=A0A7W4IFI6_9PROT|nr:hypothetical protein [Gluconacetobacter sacchari]MBB2161905.1 hypothetical protein [Gluconacetobacter sacchari]
MPMPGPDEGSRAMRRAGLSLLALMVLPSCSGLGTFGSDSFRFPGADPNRPRGDAENLRRVRGDPVAAPPILPEPGNIWPAAPDMSAATGGGEPTSGKGTAQAGLLPGESLSLGEEAAIRNGVPIAGNPLPRARAPDTPGNGHAAAGGDAVVIPNGDGSSTVISAGGDVRIIKGTELR